MFGFFDSWDLSIGIVSLVLLVPTIVHLVMKQLPSRRLRTLLALLEDTEVLFNASVEEGLLKDPDNRTFQRQLTILRGHAEAVRAEIYAAKSCGDDFSNLLRGVTRRVNNLCFRVKKLRVNISTSSMRERERRQRAAAARHSSLHGDSIPTECRPRSLRALWENAWSTICIFGTAPDVQGEEEYLAESSSEEESHERPHVVEQPLCRPHASHTVSPPPPPQQSLRALQPLLPAHARTDTEESTLCSQSISMRSYSSRSTISSRKWQLRSTPASRERALVRYLQRSRAVRAKASRLPKPPAIPSTVLASLEPWSTGEEGDWIDEETLNVIAVV